ncbi:hypothetical protein MMC07_001054 [Pseudocyphellaria aurata]|nr:hypothetical protein [Pseudocyphellaria aurata]
MSVMRYWLGSVPNPDRAALSAPTSCSDSSLVSCQKKYKRVVKKSVAFADELNEVHEVKRWIIRKIHCHPKPKRRRRSKR